MKKLGEKPHSWNAKYLLQKIERVARLRGMGTINTEPAYTPIVGMFKPSSQPGINKGATFVHGIARRFLGFEENAPKDGKRLLKNTEFLKYAPGTHRPKGQRLLEMETNEHKQNNAEGGLSKVKDAKLLEKGFKQSLRRGPAACFEPTEGDGGWKGGSSRPPFYRWNLLRTLLPVSFMGQTLPKSFSFLRGTSGLEEMGQGKDSATPFASYPR